MPPDYVPTLQASLTTGQDKQHERGLQQVTAASQPCMTCIVRFNKPAVCAVARTTAWFDRVWHVLAHDLLHRQNSTNTEASQTSAGNATHAALQHPPCTRALQPLHKTRDRLKTHAHFGIAHSPIE